MPDIRKALAAAAELRGWHRRAEPDIFREEFEANRQKLLDYAAGLLLGDREMAEIAVEATWQFCDANRAYYDPLGGDFVWWYSRVCWELIVPYLRQNGYFPPPRADEREYEEPWWTEEDARLMRLNNPKLFRHWLRCLAEAPALNAKSDQRRAELESRLSTLPTSMRIAVEKWMAWDSLDEEEGRLVRQALLLVGRRRAAA